MNLLRRIGHGLRIALLTTAAWVGPQAAAWAAATGEKPTTTYIMPYAVVILGVGLGLLVLLQPNRRRDRPRSE
jgi:hypothetical protein